MHGRILNNQQEGLYSLPSPTTDLTLTLRGLRQDFLADKSSMIGLQMTSGVAGQITGPEGETSVMDQGMTFIMGQDPILWVEGMTQGAILDLVIQETIILMGQGQTLGALDLTLGHEVPGLSTRTIGLTRVVSGSLLKDTGMGRVEVLIDQVLTEYMIMVRVGKAPPLPSHKT